MPIDGQTMKINPLIFGLLIVLAFFVGRWYPGNPSAPPASPTIAGGVSRLAPANQGRANQPQTARNAPVPPLPDKPLVVYPSLPQPPALPDKPEVVHNTGPFIDPDSRSIAPFEGPDRPARNAGEFIDPGGPPGSSR